MNRLVSQALPALLLVAAALAATLLPDAFLLEREALERGEVWRLWTGHFVHHTWAHFAFDVGVGVLLVLLLRMRLAWFVLPPVVGGTVLALEPGLTSYAGLSGVLHGLTMLVCADLFARSRGAGRVWPAAVLAGVMLKAIYETATGTSAFTGDFDMGATPLHLAHLVGAVAGCALVLLRQAGKLRHFSRSLLFSRPASSPAPVALAAARRDRAGVRRGVARSGPGHA